MARHDMAVCDDSMQYNTSAMEGAERDGLHADGAEVYAGGTEGVCGSAGRNHGRYGTYAEGWAVCGSAGEPIYAVGFG